MPAFLQATVDVMQRLYPLEHAEKWDNVGVLVEATTNEVGATRRVLLTIDLTPAVVDEAIGDGNPVDVVIAYHPLLFTPLKRLTLSSPIESSLLRLIQAGVSVYSPHTSVDAAVGGVNDWLADGVSMGRHCELSRKVIAPLANSEGGMGRVIRLSDRLPISELVKRVKTHLKIAHVHMGLSRLHSQTSTVATVAICAGSGGSLLRDVEADVLLMGECDHHTVLHAVGSGRSVILCMQSLHQANQGGHSNSERGFLPTLKHQLDKELSHEWRRFDSENEVHIGISVKDADPLCVY